MQSNLIFAMMVIIAVLVASFFIPKESFSYIKALLGIVGKIFKHREEEYPILKKINLVLDKLHEVMSKAKELGLYGKDLDTTFNKVKAFLIREVGEDNVALVPDEVLRGIVEKFHNRFTG